MKLYLFSHFFKVVDYDKRGYEAVKKFSLKFIELNYRPVFMARRRGDYSVKPQLVRVYAAMTEDKRTFHFHINQLEDFKTHLAEYFIQPEEIIPIPMYEYSKRGLKLMDGFSPRGSQPKLIDYVIDDGRGKMLSLQPGQGKTFTSLASAVKINGKIFISIDAQFFNLWDEAFNGNKKILDVDPTKQVIYVKGSQQLKKLMELSVKGELKDIEVIVVSRRTMIIYLETYNKCNQHFNGVYPIEPESLYADLDIGTRICDEFHKGLAAAFYEELHMHVNKSISLSGTPKDGSEKDRIVDVMFPKEHLMPEVEYIQYIEFNCMFYGLREPERAVTSVRGSNDYNHIAFEQYIMKNSKIKAGYYAMIKEWFQRCYVDVKVDEQKSAIFVASTEMAIDLHAYLQEAYPDLNLTHYCASIGDKYKEASQGDCMITTPKSFGTGFDIVDLIVVLQTIALKSVKTQEQIACRLRELKNYPGMTPRFFYLTCVDIPKHIEYHEEKKIQFCNKAKEQKCIFLKDVI